MPYSVQHNYFYEAKRKQGSVLLCLKDGLTEAIAWVEAQYKGRERPDRDWVTVHDETGKEVYRLEVDYMAQFEAVPGKQWHFSSSSGSGTYTTQINTTGILSCNCKGWAIKKPGKARSCKHTDEVKFKQGLKLEAKGQYWFVVNEAVKAAKSKFAGATGPAQKFAVLVQEYEEAIAIMAALDPKDMYQAAVAVETAKFKVEAYMLLLEEHGIDGTPQFLAAEAKLQQAVGRS